MKTPAPLLLGLLAACASSTSIERVDELARATDARTVLLEEHLSLYSPYDLGRTRGYLELVERERAEVFGLFGVRSDRPLVVWLRVDPQLGVHASVEGDRMRIESVSLETQDGILGHAGGGTLVVRVAPLDVVALPDGRTITGTFDVSMYADTIRHELAHAAASLLGVHGAGWLAEGLAHAVAWCPLSEERLRVDPPPDQLELAASLPREARSLAALLTWEQRFPPTDEDRVARLFAFSLVVFLLERDGAPFREAIVRIAALDETQLLALEDAWSEWLDGIAARAGS